MFRAQVCAFVGCLLMLIPASTEARDLQLSVDQVVGGDNNIFRQSNSSQEDGFWEVAPKIIVRERIDPLTYRFDYQPIYGRFAKTSGVAGWDHKARGVLDWRATQVDTIGFDGRYDDVRRKRVLVESFSGATPADPDILAERETDRLRTKTSRFNAYYSHLFTPALSGRLDYSFNDIDFKTTDGASIGTGAGVNPIDSRAHSLSAGAYYSINELTQVGVIGTGRLRENRGLGFQATTETQTGDLAFSLVRQVTPTISITARAGPSFIKTEQEIPTFRAGTFKVESDSSSVFAAVSVRKAWEHGAFNLSYSRFESGSSGTAASSIVDQVTGVVTHDFSRKWSTRLLAGWNQREQLTSVVGANDITSRSIRAVASATYKLTRKISLIGRFSYLRIANESRPQFPFRVSRSLTEFYLGSLTFRYNFDPIVF